MRLKKLKGPNLNSIFSRIKKEYEDTAYIVKTQETQDGVEVTIGLEDRSPIFQQYPLLDVLKAHHVPPDLYPTAVNTQETEFSLEAGLKSIYGLGHSYTLNQFRRPPRSKIFFGPPGVGKTLLIAKLAAFLKVNKVPVEMVTLNGHKAGVREQFKTYARAIDVPYRVLSTSQVEELFSSESPGFLRLIEFPTVPREPRLLEALEKEWEGFLVVSARHNPYEVLKDVNVYQALKVHQGVLTQVDVCTQFSNFFLAQNQQGFAFRFFSGGGSVGDFPLFVNLTSTLELLNYSPSPYLAKAA